jgi:hypothetical protein
LTEKKKGRKTLLYNLLFLAVGGGVVLFLLNAPPESTKRLPHDENHLRFHQMEKKAAEKFCEECHSPDGQAGPLPKDHPPKYRCLFCHKKDR